MKDEAMTDTDDAFQWPDPADKGLRGNLCNITR